MVDSRNSALALVVLVCACSRPSSDEPEGETTSAVSVATSAAAPTPPPPPPSAAPAKTPTVPPQILACGRHVFHRITSRALEIFEIARELPPPGSRVAQKTTEVLVDGASSVVSLPGDGALAIAKTTLVRHTLGKKGAELYPPLAAGAPLFASVPSSGVRAVRTHAPGDKQILEFALGAPTKGRVAPTESGPRAVTSATALPDFDSRLFALLADGTPLYSTAQGLVVGAGKPRPVTSGEIPTRATLLFADPAPNAYWLADDAGHIERRLVDTAGAPTLQESVPGVVIDTAISGAHLAVLSLRPSGPTYRPAVSLFAEGKRVTHRDLAASMGTSEQPELDLCLIEGLPWVVVGNEQWLTLIDLETPRLLAEW